MNDDEDDRVTHYEDKAINAISEAKSAVIGSSRGLWHSLPNWLRQVLEYIVGVGFVLCGGYFVLLYIVVPLLRAFGL